MEVAGGHSSPHKNHHSHWKILHGHAHGPHEEENVAHDAHAQNAHPYVGGLLRGLHCCFGSLWVIWRRTLLSLTPNQVRPHVCVRGYYGIRSIPLGLEPKKLSIISKNRHEKALIDSKQIATKCQLNFTLVIKVWSQDNSTTFITFKTFCFCDI